MGRTLNIYDEMGYSWDNKEGIYIKRAVYTSKQLILFYRNKFFILLLMIIFYSFSYNFPFYYLIIISCFYCKIIFYCISDYAKNV